MGGEDVSTLGHRGERPSAKPISLLTHYKKNKKTRKTFLAQVSTWSFFFRYENLELEKKGG